MGRPQPCTDEFSRAVGDSTRLGWAEETTLYVVVGDDPHRRLRAVCDNLADAERSRQASARPGVVADQPRPALSIHAMRGTFRSVCYRIVRGAPLARPAHPLVVPEFQRTDGQAELVVEEHTYPDRGFADRAAALAAAAIENFRRLKEIPGVPDRWAVVIEIGEPLRRPGPSRCVLRDGWGWEESSRVRPVRLVVPTADEVALPCLTQC